MGTKQLSEIQSDIRIRLGLSDSDAKATDAIVNTYINAAIDQLNNMRAWWWNEASRTFSTVVDQASYAFAADFAKTVVMAYGDQVIPFRTKGDLIKYEDYEGEPRFYTIEAGQYVIYPTPDAVYELKEVYQAVEPDLTTDTDTTAWPDDKIDLVTVKAAMLLAAKVKPEMIQVLSPELQSIYQSLTDETMPTLTGALPRRRNDWRP